jgi:hypothetical protein
LRLLELRDEPIGRALERREAKEVLAEAASRGLWRQSPKLLAYRQQARARREIRAVFSASAPPPPGKKKATPHCLHDSPARQILTQNLGPVEAVSASPDAPDGDGNFDESLAARLERRYGGEGPWRWT